MIAVAVLDQDERGQLALTADRTWRVSQPIASLADLVRLADKLRAYQLWVHPRWSAAHPDLELPHWSAHSCEDERQHLTIAVPADDQQMEPLAAAADGATLLGALLALEEALQTHFRGTPGKTGTELLRTALGRRGLLLEPNLPPPATLRPPAEGDYGWIRQLTEPERSRRWLHAFDKHGMYLVACGTVELGVGDPDLLIEPSFDPKLPGYWHVRTSWPPLDELLPDPTRTRPARRRDADADEFRWLTTPSVAAASHAGRLDQVAAAWVWTRHTRALALVASHFRAARELLARRATCGDTGAAIALSVVKPTYTATFGGWLAMHGTDDRPRDSDPLYRPDWRDMVKAEARTRLWHNLRPLAEADRAPCAIATDAIFIASDDEDPRAVVGELLELGPAPRQWAWQGRAPLDELAPLFERPYVGRLASAFREVASLG
jgi:hypothetical protein